MSESETRGAADTQGDGDATFIGPRHRERPAAESVVVRIVATCGIIGIAVALAAVLGWQDVAAWLIGLVVSTFSVAVAALLWSSRRL
jgi:hypothetical protein